MESTPELPSKYLVRRVPDEARESLIEQGKRSRDYYRRYFRDFSTGFGNIGGQGGRMA